eukprot:g14173.t1
MVDDAGGPSASETLPAAAPGGAGAVSPSTGREFTPLQAHFSGAPAPALAAVESSPTAASAAPPTFALSSADAMASGDTDNERPTSRSPVRDSDSETEEEISGSGDAAGASTLDVNDDHTGLAEPGSEIPDAASPESVAQPTTARSALPTSMAMDAGRTIEFVLQALSYGPNDAADSEKVTMLLSAAGETVQILHKDQPGKTVDERLGTDVGSGLRARSEPAPHSAVFAFMEDTVLHVIDGSHIDPLGDEYCWEDSKEIKVADGFTQEDHDTFVTIAAGDNEMATWFTAMSSTQSGDGDSGHRPDDEAASEEFVDSESEWTPGCASQSTSSDDGSESSHSPMENGGGDFLGATSDEDCGGGSDDPEYAKYADYERKIGARVARQHLQHTGKSPRLAKGKGKGPARRGVTSGPDGKAKPAKKKPKRSTSRACNGNGYLFDR